jgi:hypothetical protein
MLSKLPDRALLGFDIGVARAFSPSGVVKEGQLGGRPKKGGADIPTDIRAA